MEEFATSCGYAGSNCYCRLRQGADWWDDDRSKNHTVNYVTIKGDGVYMDVSHVDPIRDREPTHIVCHGLELNCELE